MPRVEEENYTVVTNITLSPPDYWNEWDEMKYTLVDKPTHDITLSG